jgi:hypothetical protein
VRWFAAGFVSMAACAVASMAAPAPAVAAAAHTPTTAVAAAAPTPMLMEFNASPEPTVQGQPTKLSGRTWYHATGNQRKIRFYHRATHTTTYVYAGYTWSNDAGYFSRSFPATTSGTWYARALDTDVRPGVQKSDYVRVLGRKAVLLSKVASTGQWTGPTIDMPTVDFTVTWKYACESDIAPFFFLSWNAHPDVYEYLGRDEQEGVGTYRGAAFRGHEGGREGWFDVAAQGDCAWTIWVYSDRQWVLV